MNNQATNSFASVIRASFCFCRPLENPYITQHDPSCATAFETGASHHLCWSDVTQRKIAFFFFFLFPLIWFPLVAANCHARRRAAHKVLTMNVFRFFVILSFFPLPSPPCLFIFYFAGNEAVFVCVLFFSVLCYLGRRLGRD